MKKETLSKAIFKRIGASDWKQTSEFQPLTMEKVIGINNLLSIAWLNRGLEMANSVARIITPEGIGTGFLIAPDLLITNNHVLNTEESATKSMAEFNYQNDWTGRLEPSQRYSFDATYFMTNENLDYTIVRLNGNPGELFGFIDPGLIRIPLVNDYVCIIQHPNGGPKQIALTDNKVAAVFDTKVQYSTDTEPGSSGSPVFDQNWNIVALHQRGGMLPGPDRRDYFINEGILINKILQDAQKFLGLHDTIYDVSFGELRSDLVLLIREGRTLDEIYSLANDLIHKHPTFSSALHNWVQINRESNQVDSLLGAEIGVSIGAAIRHWAREAGHEAIGAAATSDPFPSEKQFTIMSPYRNSNKLPREVYDSVLETVRKKPELVESIIDRLRDDIQKVIPALEVIFLVGATVGAKAYDGNSDNATNATTTLTDSNRQNSIMLLRQELDDLRKQMVINGLI